MSVHKFRCVRNQTFPTIPTDNECWCSGKSEHLTKWDCGFINSEADEISPEDLEAAGEFFDRCFNKRAWIDKRGGYWAEKIDLFEIDEEEEAS